MIIFIATRCKGFSVVCLTVNWSNEIQLILFYVYSYISTIKHTTLEYLFKDIDAEFLSHRAKNFIVCAFIF